MPPSAEEPLPGWHSALTRRAGAALPDPDVQAALDYIDRLRRERDRLYAQLTSNFGRIKTALDLLDRFERDATLIGTVTTAEVCRLVRAALIQPPTGK